jgi:hypothetical protein
LHINNSPVRQAVFLAYKPAVADSLWEKNTVPRLISRADKLSRTGEYQYSLPWKILLSQPIRQLIRSHHTTKLKYYFSTKFLSSWISHKITKSTVVFTTIFSALNIHISFNVIHDKKVYKHAHIFGWLLENFLDSLDNMLPTI